MLLLKIICFSISFSLAQCLPLLGLWSTRATILQTSATTLIDTACKQWYDVCSERVKSAPQIDQEADVLLQYRGHLRRLVTATCREYVAEDSRGCDTNSHSVLHSVILPACHGPLTEDDSLS